MKENCHNLHSKYRNYTLEQIQKEMSYILAPKGLSNTFGLEGEWLLYNKEGEIDRKNCVSDSTNLSSIEQVFKILNGNSKNVHLEGASYMIELVSNTERDLCTLLNNLYGLKEQVEREISDNFKFEVKQGLIPPIEYQNKMFYPKEYEYYLKPLFKKVSNMGMSWENLIKGSTTQSTHMHFGLKGINSNIVTILIQGELILIMKEFMETQGENYFDKLGISETRYKNWRNLTENRAHPDMPKQMEAIKDGEKTQITPGVILPFDIFSSNFNHSLIKKLEKIKNKEEFLEYIKKIYNLDLEKITTPSLSNFVTSLKKPGTLDYTNEIRFADSKLNKEEIEDVIKLYSYIYLLALKRLEKKGYL